MEWGWTGGVSMGMAHPVMLLAHPLKMERQRDLVLSQGYIFFFFSFLSFTHLFIIIFYTHHGEVFKTDCLGFCLFTSLPTKLDGSQRSLLDGP